MKDSICERLDSELRRWRYFEECLLIDVQIVEFGYSVNLTFNYIWDDSGQVRPDVQGDPRLVILTLVGVDFLSLSGGLTPAMKSTPQQIDWGLSEVARVVCAERGGAVSLSVEWEGARNIDVIFTDYRVRYV